MNLGKIFIAGFCCMSAMEYGYASRSDSDDDWISVHDDSAPSVHYDPRYRVISPNPETEWDNCELESLREHVRRIQTDIARLDHKIDARNIMMNTTERFSLLESHITELTAKLRRVQYDSSRREELIEKQQESLLKMFLDFKEEVAIFKVFRENTGQQLKIIQCKLPTSSKFSEYVDLVAEYRRRVEGQSEKVAAQSMQIVGLSKQIASLSTQIAAQPTQLIGLSEDVAAQSTQISDLFALVNGLKTQLSHQTSDELETKTKLADLSMQVAAQSLQISDLLKQLSLQTTSAND
ncbi:MAG: hypothetical protein LBJ89_05025 [Holosporales bacterium]|jgi:chromosome segregation ATPase|nr:hypothetical protein [Holosporales bacterium]